jgi:hypothetical protein
MGTSSKNLEKHSFLNNLTFDPADSSTRLTTKSCHCPTGVATTIFGKEWVDKRDYVIGLER